MDSGITFLSFLPICGEKTFNLKKEYKMKRYLISTTLVASALSTLAAGRDYRDDYGSSDYRQQQVRKAPEQEVDTETLKLAMRLEELKIKRAKQERELEKEKARTAEAQARRAEAEARTASARGQTVQRNLPRLENWTREDATEACRRAKAGDVRCQMQLGIVFELGYAELAPDFVKAAHWYKKAAENGERDGEKYLSRVRRKMKD